MDAETVAALVATVLGGPDVDPSIVAQELAAAPADGRGALALVLEALVPFAAGAPAEPEGALLELGRAVDAARPTLEVWSAAATAARLQGASAPPEVRLPDADASVPPLRLGLAAAHARAEDLPAPALLDAVRGLSEALGRDVSSDDEASAARIAHALTPEQHDAVSRVLAATTAYITASREAARMAPPRALADDPTLVARWADDLEAGILPDPFSPAGTALREAGEYLRVQLRASDAQDALLAAAEAVAPAFTPSSRDPPDKDPVPPTGPSGLRTGSLSMPLNAPPAPLPEPFPAGSEEDPIAPQPASAPHSDTCREAPGIPKKLSIPGVLSLDLCGHDTTWTPQDLAVLLIDVGGDDTYEGQYGGAPFQIPNLPGSLHAPVALLFDAGGSDTYNATDINCAHGAACGGAFPQDPTETRADEVAPVGVLVDWDGDGVDVTNRFMAGHKSQGYASDEGNRGAGVRSGPICCGIPDTGRHANQLQLHVLRSYGILVESVGRDASLESHFLAGNQTQGSTVPADEDGDRPLAYSSGEAGPRSSSGLLVRLVGSHSVAQGHFEAGEASQAAASFFGRPSHAALINVAGRDAVSHDHYKADQYSQAAIVPPAVTHDDASLSLSSAQQAIFADIVGSGGRSNDTYDAPTNARGYLPATIAVGLRPPAATTALFLDALLPNEPSLTASPGDGKLEAAVTATTPGYSDDTYSSLIPTGQGGSEEGYGWGRNGGFFIEIGGDDKYPPDNSSVGNERTWNLIIGNAGIGMDTAALDDRDGDAFPRAVDALLGSDDDPDQTPSPVHPRIHIDLGTGGPPSPLNRTYGMVLSVAGDNTYGPAFSAAVHLDLAGHDTYLGQAAAAGSPVPACTHSPQLLLSFLLDASGDDTYGDSDAPACTQGYGGSGGVGLLVDLQGNDDYRAKSHAQGIGQAGGVGVLVDLHDAVPRPDAPGLRDPPPEVNRFHLEEGPGQGYGSAGLGLLVATGSHNTFHDGDNSSATVPPQVTGAADDARDRVPGPVRDALGQVVFPTQVPLPDGWHTQGTGASFNAGNNTAPRVGSVQSTVPAGGADLLQTYAFNATVVDDDGDPVALQWRFQHGNGWATRNATLPEGGGVSEVTYAWSHVDTVAPLAHRDFEVSVHIVDPGGMTNETRASFGVLNPPPRFVEGTPVRGPTVVEANVPNAFQVPVVHEADVENHTVRIDWGDGTRSELTTTEVDWARSAFGATIHVPSRSGAYPDATGAADVENLGNAVDGNNQTGTVLTFQPGISTRPPTIQFLIHFAGERQVRELRLEVANDDRGNKPVLFSVEGLPPTGPPVPLALEEVKDTDGRKMIKIPLTDLSGLSDLPDLRGLLVRQILPSDHDPGDVYSLAVYSVEARGPGGVKAWTAPGTYEVGYAAVDHYGGSNQTTFPVQVVDTAGSKPTAPVSLADVGGRGPVRHASLVALHEYTLTLESHVDLPADWVRVDWGDGTTSACRMLQSGAKQDVTKTSWAPEGLSPSWNAPGNYDVNVSYFRTGWEAPTLCGDDGDQEGEPEEVVAFTAHVEAALDLRTDDGTPLAYLALDPVGGRTWHEWPERRDPLVLVDASGDDRYPGRVAASFPLPSLHQSHDPESVNLGAMPRLVVDAAGDDDYLSTGPGTQGFGALGGIALLLDALGSDRYVANGSAQGAAHFGVGALVDLGGDDAYNLLAPDDPLVRGGYASNANAWLERPDALVAGRPMVQPPSASLMQGAAEEGFGILVASGGRDVFNAAGRAQGYGSHRADVEQAADYAVPGEDCPFPPDSGDPEGALDYLEGSVPSTSGSLLEGDPQVNPGQNPIHAHIACMLGIQNIRHDPGYYQPDGQGALGQPNMAWEPEYQPDPDDPSRNDSRCRVGGGGGGATPAVHNPITGNCQPNANGLLSFLADGPRYGPGVGMLVRLDGASAYHADEWAQGSAREAGRGILLDRGGGLVASATQHAQAYARGGTAGLVADGATVLRLGHNGQAAFDQATVSPEAGLASQAARAVLLGGGIDRLCTGSCGSPTGLSNLDPERLFLDVPAPGAPSVQVTEEASDGSEEVTLTVELDEPTGPFEVVAVSTPLPLACEGAPIAPPAIFFATTTTESTVSVVLDTAEGDRGPLHPAGCVEVHVLARLVGTGPTAWGHGAHSVMLLPPPRLAVHDPPFLAGDGTPLLRALEGTPLDVELESREPLSRGDPPHVSVHLLDAAGVDVDSVDVDPGSGQWRDGESGGIVGLQVTPPGVGDYTLCVRADWTAPPSPEQTCHEVARAMVRDDTVHLTANQLPEAARRSTGLPVGGEAFAFDASLIQAIRLRAVTDQTGDSLALELQDRQPFCPPHGPSDDTQTCATMDPLNLTHVAWHAPLRVGPQTLPEGTIWYGGPVRVEASVKTTGWSSWLDLGTVIIDDSPPTVTDVRTPDGTAASRGSTEVVLDVTAHDTGADDQCAPACPAGSGVDADTTWFSVLVPGEGGPRIVPLQRLSTQQGNDPSLTMQVRWQADADGDGDVIPEGSYEMLAVVADRAGNTRAYNPGIDLVVDRTPPTLSLGSNPVQLPTMETPLGNVTQTAVRPGDLVQVRVVARDSLGLEGVWVQAVGLPDMTSLDPEENPLPGVATAYKGTLTVPDNVPDGELRVEFLAKDLAGNTIVVADGETYPFLGAPFTVEGPESKPRSDAIRYQWSTDRPVHAVAVLHDAADPEGLQLAGEVEFESDGSTYDYHVEFQGLLEGTEYEFDLTLWDEAGHLHEFLQEVTTKVVPPGLALTLDPLPDVTFNGTVEITGRVIKPLEGIVRLRLADSAGLPVRDPAEIPDDPSGWQAFTLTWDSTQNATSLVRAVEVPLIVEFTDGSVSRATSILLRVDNAPPVVEPWIEAAPPRNGWYNGTVRVHAGAVDDTGPLSHQTSVAVDGADTRTGDDESVVLTADGINVVQFRVEDGAVPPNVALVPHVISVDRTPPELEAELLLDVPATSDRTVPLHVQASDPTSGVDAFRVHAGEWTPWTQQVPAAATLLAGPDREQWIHVEARDVAGNVRQQTMSVTLDRTPPEIVTARWVGWTQTNGTDQPVLYLFARDLLNGTARPAGVEAVRFLPDGTEAWGPWINTTGNEAFPVDAASGLLVQVRDHAHNTASVRVDDAPAPTDATVGGNGTAPAPGGSLIHAPSASPQRGVAGDTFAFTATVSPHGGQEPDGVWVEVGGVRTPMHPSGPVLQDGSRLYAANLTLEPTRLHEPHTFRVIAAYGPHEETTDVLRGPLVAALGSEEDTHGDGRGIPTANPLSIVVLLATLVFTRRRMIP